MTNTQPVYGGLGACTKRDSDEIGEGRERESM